MSTAPLTSIVEQLQWRYATKAFDPTKKISDADWSALEDSLVLTPSSYGLQPWKFLVVSDAAVREQLMPHAWGQRQVVDASHFVVFCAVKKLDEAFVDEYLADMATKRGIPTESLRQLRAMILGALSQMDDAAALNWSAKQCYIALGNLMTVAAMAGIDTCPMEGFVPAKFDEILGLEAKGFASVVACPVGYRSAEDKFATLPKIRWEKPRVVNHV